MGSEPELGHDAEIAAAAPDRPEQVRLLFGVDAQQAAVRHHDVHAQQAVDGEAEPAAQPSHPAAEGETGDTGVRNNAGRRHLPMWQRGRVDVAKQGTAGNLGCSRFGIDQHLFHER